MWFKNIALFELQKPFKLDAAELAEKLGERRFSPCLSQQMLSDGWVAPLGRKAVDLVHAVNNCFLICLQVEEKVLPAAVIKELLGDKVAEIEDREMRRVRRREKDQLRDELMLELTPRAFTRSRRSFAYIDRDRGWLIIDSASPKGIDELTSQLRETLGSLSLSLPQVASAPAAVMSDWLANGNVPADVDLEDECELRDGEGVVRCKGQELTSDEIRVHLQAGKQVTRLNFIWADRIGLVLSDDLLIRRLRFTELVQEKLHSNGDDEAQLFDAQFALMSGELRQFLPRLLDYFK